MKIAVCDDDRFYRENMSRLLNLYSERNPQHDLSITIFKCADELLSVARKIGGFDIYILDVIMPDINGIELGLRLRDDNFDGKIIYLTSSGDYALDSFKTQPFNYIIKPVEIEKLFPVLDKAIEDIGQKKEKSIIVKTADGNVKLSLDGIMYAELLNRNIHFHLANGKTVESVSVRTSFSTAIKELTDDERFEDCGSSFVINLLHISVLKQDELCFSNGTVLKLPKKPLSRLREKWAERQKEELKNEITVEK